MVSLRHLNESFARSTCDCHFSHVVDVSGNISRYAAERIYKKAPGERDGRINGFKVYRLVARGLLTSKALSLHRVTLSLNFLASRGEGAYDTLESFVGVFSILLLNEQR